MSLTLVPMGGLANRMRAILSAWSLSTRLGEPLRICWLRDKGLNARFSDLFEPVPQFHVDDISGWKSFRFQQPRKKNLFIPRLLQAGYEQVLFDSQLASLQQEPHRLSAMVAGKHVLIGSGLGFYPADSSRYASFFVPRREILDRVNAALSGFSDNVVGVHIRRTDNAMSIQSSPLEAFVERMRDFPDARFYLATDSEAVRAELEQLFPGRVMGNGRAASRGTLDGMRDAVAEMYLLSQTAYFLGSYYSSFSDIIVEMSGKGEIVRG